MSFMQPQLEAFEICEGDEYEVCPDCLMMIANGDSSGASDDWNPDSMSELNLAPKSVDDCGNEYLNEGSFSHSGCECCGSQLGGDRYTCADIDSIERRPAYRWRLSAPGYLDCTDWSVADTPLEAVDDILGMYGDGFDESDLREVASWLDCDFDAALEGYLLAIVFTGHRYESEESEPEPIVSNPGGDIRDVIDSDDVWDMLSEEQRLTVLHDLLGFITQAIPVIGDDTTRDDIPWTDLGSDFHYTRNRHGCGFWDGDWPEHGAKLTEYAKTWGTSELSVYGDSVDLGG